MKQSILYTRYLEIVGVGYKAATIQNDFKKPLALTFEKTPSGLLLTQPHNSSRGIPQSNHGTLLQLKLGLSHDILIEVPFSVRVFCFKPTLICCVGTNKNVLTQFAAHIRDIKPPEIYKGKGIRYRNEIIQQKQGKKK